MMLLTSLVTKQHPPPPNDSVIVRTHSSIPHTYTQLWMQAKLPSGNPPDRLFWLRLCRTSAHMEMFPRVGINLARGWKKFHRPWSCSEIHDRKNKFSLRTTAWPRSASLRQNAPSSLDDCSFLLVISMEFTSYHKHFHLDLISCGLECTVGWVTQDRSVWV